MQCWELLNVIILPSNFAALIVDTNNIHSSDLAKYKNLISICSICRVLIRSKNILIPNKMHFNITRCILFTMSSPTCFGRYSGHLQHDVFNHKNTGAVNCGTIKRTPKHATSRSITPFQLVHHTTVQVHQKDGTLI